MIDTAKEREKLALVKGAVLLRCEGCAEEMNCHHADEMLIGGDGALYCDLCMDGSDDPQPWTASPDPVQIALAAMDEIDRLRAEKETLGRETNKIRYGEPDFAWSMHKDVMQDLRDEIDRLTVERDEARAQVAMAFEMAADACADYPRVAPDATEWPHYDAQIEHSQACIRVLTPDDAKAALQRVVDATWNEAVESCAAVFDTHGDRAASEALGQLICCNGHMCGGCRGATVGEYLKHLTLDLKRPEASHE